MSKETKTLNFENQVFVIGIDTHLKNWKVTIRNNGLELKTFSMNPSPIELYTYMKKNYPGGTYRSVYEAGFCGFWIHRELTKLGVENIITNPADIPSTHKEKDRKSDAIDSRKLSREMENKSLVPIYVPSPKSEALRSLSRIWRQYSRRGVQIKNRIKGFLYFCGVKIPDGFETSHWSNNYMKMLRELKFDEDVNRLVLDEHIEELEHIRIKRLALLGKIREMSKEIPVIQYLRTVPGVGQLVAFVLYAELIDIRRFKNLDNLLAYVGLVPSTSKSDETEYIRGITKRHSKHLRYLLIESAWVAVRKDPALTAAFNELTKRELSKKHAILRIAKKLVNRIRFVWLHQTAYVTAVVE